jgi:hypothetical protein
MGMPPAFATPLQKCALRILSALFQAIEGRGGTIGLKAHAPSSISMTLRGQQIEICLIERRTQVRTPLSAKERRERWNADRKYTQTLKPTGELVFRIKEYPSGLRTEWKEREGAPLVAMLPDIVAGLILAATRWGNALPSAGRRSGSGARSRSSARKPRNGRSGRRPRSRLSSPTLRPGGKRDAEAFVREVESRLRCQDGGRGRCTAELGVLGAGPDCYTGPLSRGQSELLREPDCD